MKSYVEGLSEGAMEVGPPSREFLVVCNEPIFPWELPKVLTRCGP